MAQEDNEAKILQRKTFFLLVQNFGLDEVLRVFLRCDKADVNSLCWEFAKLALNGGAVSD